MIRIETNSYKIVGQKYRLPSQEYGKAGISTNIEIIYGRIRQRLIPTSSSVSSPNAWLSRFQKSPPSAAVSLQLLQTHNNINVFRSLSTSPVHEKLQRCAKRPGQAAARLRES